MMMNKSPELRVSIFFFIFFLFISLWIFAVNLWTVRFSLVDDAFIAFRYARNLINGHGLTWNPGEHPSDGYTYLLSVLLFAPFIFFKFNPIVVSGVTGIVAVALTAFLLYKACRLKEISQPVALLVSGIYLASPATAFHALTGMQAPVFSLALFFLFFCALAIRRDGKPAWYVFWFLAYLAVVLARSEGVFFALSFLAFFYFYPKNNAGRFNRRLAVLFMLCLAVTGFYLLWNYFYFGTIIPAPLSIKVIKPLFFPGKFELIAFILHYPLIFLFAFAAMAIPGRKHLLTQYSFFLAVMILFTYLFNCHFMGQQGRFFIPSIPFLLLLAADSLELLISKIKKRTLPVFLVTCLVFFSPANINPPGTSFIETRRLFFRSQKPHLESWVDVNIKIGKQLAKIKNVAQLVVAAEDVGALGYYSNAKVIDLVGLTNTYIAASRNAGEFRERVLSYRPDIVMARSMRNTKILATPVQFDHAKATPPVFAFGPLGRFGQQAITEHEEFIKNYVYLGSISDSDPSIAQYDWIFWVRVDSLWFQQTPTLIDALRNP